MKEHEINIKINEEDLNNFTTILEEKNISESEYILKAVKSQLDKDLAKYKQVC